MMERELIGLIVLYALVNCEVATHYEEFLPLMDELPACGCARAVEQSCAQYEQEYEVQR